MSDEKEVVNADEYAAMRQELVALYRIVIRLLAETAYPIASKLSKQEGGNDRLSACTNCSHELSRVWVYCPHCGEATPSMPPAPRT
jgi:hypothetical protein